MTLKKVTKQRYIPLGMPSTG